MRTKWAAWVKSGTLVLYTEKEKLKIRFGKYTSQESSELIQFFRTAFVDRDHEGWEQFEKKCMPPAIDYEKLRAELRRHLRFAVIAWGAAVPVIYVALIWQKLNDGLPNGSWFVVAVYPIAIPALIVGRMWLAARRDLARATRR